MRGISNWVGAVTVLFSVALTALPAYAERIECNEVPYVPYTIDTPGVWCLKHDLSTSMASGCAIAINVNNVTLDLNDFKVGGLAAGLGTDARGVCALCRKNVTVRNGTVRGFLAGVQLLGGFFSGGNDCAQAYVVENIRAESNTYAGIWVGGMGGVIRNNLVVSTGGTTLYPSSINTGIYVDMWSSNVVVLNNDVINTFNTPYPVAAEAIHAYASDNCMVINNRVSGAHIGIRFQNSTGLYRGNTVGNIDPNGGSAYSGGTNAGDNYP